MLIFAPTSASRPEPQKAFYSVLCLEIAKNSTSKSQVRNVPFAVSFVCEYGAGRFSSVLSTSVFGDTRDKQGEQNPAPRLLSPHNRRRRSRGLNPLTPTYHIMGRRRHNDYDDDFENDFDQDAILDIMFDRDEDFNDDDDGCGAFMG